jgi:hypothetical protein
MRVSRVRLRSDSCSKRIGSNRTSGVVFSRQRPRRRILCSEYDTIVCTEVLEHIDADLDVIRLWRDGAWCVCTVPNFDYAGHVRFFRAPDEVAARYGELIDIVAVIRIARPIMPDGRIRTYLRNLRWSRDDPTRFLGFLGIQTFDRLGGWFLFYETKRHQVPNTGRAGYGSP